MIKDEFLGGKAKYIQSKKQTMYIARYVITNLPKNWKQDLDIIDSVLAKAREYWHIKDADELYDYHSEQENDETAFYYSVMIPLERAIQIRRSERYSQWKKGKPITQRQKKLFSEAEKRMWKRDKIDFNKVPLFYDYEDAGLKSPLKSPGLPKDDEE